MNHAKWAMSNEDKFIKQLQKAHAGEIAAFWAYKGHQEAAKNDADQLALIRIRQDEYDHIMIIESLLKRNDAEPNKHLDFQMWLIGNAIYFLCKFTGYKITMKVAGWFETLGKTGYTDMAKLAEQLNKPYAAQLLRHMGDVEAAHERFFEAKVQVENIWNAADQSQENS
jgi:ferritin-like metal-binding protein YciE